MEQTDSADPIQEIRYLKGLLDANGIAYDYQAYKESQRIAEEEDEIEIPNLTREHAIAFYSMFRGRKDVFAKRSAKKGYFTQCDRVIPQTRCYERYAVIDDAVVWYGSMNLLSNEKDDDNVMRLVSPPVAAELMEVSARFPFISK